MTKLSAFHGKRSEKTAILKQLRAHHKADEIVNGWYWEDGKGCAVGCTLHDPRGGHEAYVPQFGIPEMLARLEDEIFGGLPNEQAMTWPIRFMQAIEPGADLRRVGWQFLYWLLTEESVNPGIDHPLVRDAVRRCADVLLPLIKGQSANNVQSARAARAAWSAARAAAWSAWSASSASAAWSTASAAWSAWSAASAASSAAAWSAARAASAAGSSAAAWSAAGSWSAESAAAFVQMSKKLLTLLKEAS